MRVVRTKPLPPSEELLEFWRWCTEPRRMRNVRRAVRVNRCVASTRLFWLNWRVALDEGTWLGGGDRRVLRMLLRRHATLEGVERIRRQVIGDLLSLPLILLILLPPYTVGQLLGTDVDGAAAWLIWHLFVFIAFFAATTFAAALTFPFGLWSRLFANVLAVGLLAGLAWWLSQHGEGVARWILSLSTDIPQDRLPTVNALSDALTAGVILAAFSALWTVGGREFRRWIFEPFMRRRVGVLPPCQTAAVEFLYVAKTLHKNRQSWRRPRVRLALRREISRVARTAPIAIRQATRALGGTSNDGRVARLQGRKVSDSLQAHSRSVLDAFTQDDYDKVVNDISEQAFALANGDWSLLEDDVVALRSQRAAIRRRLVPAAVLVASALSLPHLPGVVVTGSALVSLQVSLLAGAVTVLVAADAGVRDLITSAIKDAGKRST